jgi:6-pyruvoyltetrahydropterin/6-carboxytetrahydropterin synthase
VFIELTRIFKFDAAHCLTRLPKDHKCARLHGHSYRLDVTVAGEVSKEQGWLMDYAEINRVVSPVIEILDHAHLNDIPGLDNPTSENLALWVWNKIKPGLPLLVEISVWESENSRCRYRGE